MSSAAPPLAKDASAQDLVPRWQRPASGMDYKPKNLQRIPSLGRCQGNADGSYSGTGSISPVASVHFSDQTMPCSASGILTCMS
jgi:hypothetical protein